MKKIPTTEVFITEEPYASLWIMFAFPAEQHLPVSM